MHVLSSLSTPGLILALILLAIPIVPNLWSIWHAFHRDFPTVQEKMIWLCVAIFIPVLGGLAYVFFGRPRARKPAPWPSSAQKDES